MADITLVLQHGKHTCMYMGIKSMPVFCLKIGFMPQDNEARFCM
jgi:hypothetical protein